MNKFRGGEAVLTQGKDHVCSHYLIQKAKDAQLNASLEPLQEGICDVVEHTHTAEGITWTTLEGRAT